MPTILITGITGSLGHRLVSHFLKKGYQVRGLSRCEDKQATMKRKHPEVDFFLGDVRDYHKCEVAISDCDMVIHTAALKRVEVGEVEPWEFIKTNLIGTMNMVKAAKKMHINNFVFISSDKAVRPINAYGMTKALAEKIVTNAGYNCVRYGNVNNSRGSVLPYWKNLIESGKSSVPVTNPTMTRFLISFEEAIELINTAMAQMNGETYVPKLKAVSIEVLSSMYGKYHLVGERPAEKLHEELVHRDEFREGFMETDRYYVLKRGYPTREGPEEGYTSEVAQQHTKEELKEYLKEVLPSF